MAEQYNPMLLGSLPEDEGSPVNPLALAGLGGAAAFQGMFPFASEPTASNIIGRNLPAGGVNPQVTGPVSQGLFQSSNIIGRNLPAGGANPQVTGPVSQGSLRPAPNQPVLMGQPRSYQGVPTGPNTPPQFTGNAPARPIPGTQLAPPNQPPAVSSAGGAPANTTRPMKVAQRVGPPATISGTPQAKPSLIKNVASGLFKAGAIGALATPNTVADATLGGAYERRVAAGEDPDQVRQSLGLASDYGEIQLLPESELAAAQMSRLGDEPLVFNAPTGPSSTATQAAQIAATLPDDSGLMGAPGVQETGTPTTTLNIDGGSATVPQGLADPTFQTLNPMKEAEPGSPQAIFERIRAKGALSPELIAAGQARAEAMGTTFDPEAGFSRDAYLAGQADPGPMGRDATMDRLGGRTLNEYLNAPDGTEGVSGLRTDPQGRMIPAGFDTRADAYGSYEREAAAREARQAARPDFGAAISDRERRGTGEMSMADATDMFGSSKAARAAILRQRQGLNPVTGNREKTEAERAQSEQQGQLQNEVLQARLDSFQQTDPDKLSKAQAYAERLGLTGDSATAFIFSQMGTSMDDIFGLEGTGAGGGGGSFTEAQQSSISKVMAANPGSSREQIIAEMKKQGKL